MRESVSASIILQTLPPNPSLTNPSLTNPSLSLQVSLIIIAGTRVRHTDRQRESINLTLCYNKYRCAKLCIDVHNATISKSHLI
jgi:hypothetical protein